MKKIIFLAASALASIGLNASAGDLTGTVTFKGTAPAEIDFADAIQAEPTCSVLYSGATIRF